MPDFQKKYRALSNLQLRKLQREAHKLGPEAAAALETEANRRGLATPPKRVTEPTTKPSKSFGQRAMKWFDVQGGRPGSIHGEVLDAPIGVADGHVESTALRNVLLAWLGYIFLQFLLAGLYYPIFFGGSFYTTGTLWLDVLTNSPWLLDLVIAFGLLKRRHWGLAGVAFLLGFGGMGVAKSIIFLASYLAEYSDRSDLWFAAKLVVIPAVAIGGILYLILQPGVNKGFGVGPKFIQSYVFIGISLGILYLVLSNIVMGNSLLYGSY